MRHKEPVKTQVIHIEEAPTGWEDDPSFCYIGHAGHGQDGYFGNPFLMSSHPGTYVRGSTLGRYQLYLNKRIKNDARFRRRVKELKGKTLVCFCKPKPCHGDMLATAADTLE